MGSYLNHTVFLEFYGLPGSGKSTISHAVAGELRKRGNIVIEPTYELIHRRPRYMRMCIKLLQMVEYALLHPKKYITLIKLVRRNGYFRIIDVFAHISNIIQKIWVYNKSDADYIIFDQGITQSAISLSQENHISSLYNEKQLYGLCRSRDVKKIYIVVSIQEAIRRMSYRDKHGSRIEKITDIEKKKTIMKLVERQCEIISGTKIDGEKSVDENKKRITNFAIGRR